MGLYLETPGHDIGKAFILERELGGDILPVVPPLFEEVPDDEVLIAVVANPRRFEAALVCSNTVDYYRALNERRRPVTWMRAPRDAVLARLRAQGVDENRLEAYEVTKGR